MNVLTFCDHYLPGYRAGGPIRSVSAIVERLSDDARFAIVTRDRDFGTDRPFDGIDRGAWTPVGRAEVRYLAPDELTMAVLGAILRQRHVDVVYLNSLFSPAFTIRTLVLRRLGRVPDVPFLVAPRGELSPGALEIRSTKKQAYLAVASAAGLYDGVHWHLTSERERDDLRASPLARRPGVVREDHIWIAPPIPSSFEPPGTPTRDTKRRGTLRVAFLSRISPKKNLDFALQALHGLEGQIQFDAYGPVEDPAYWRRCSDVAESLPPNVTFRLQGVVEPDAVGRTLSGYDLFLFPTRGENFGHVIWESLAAGCPVLISDQTPWSGLEEAGAGWARPLEVESFRAVLRQLVACGEEDARARAVRSRQYAEAWLVSSGGVERMRRVFEGAAGMGSRVGKLRGRE